MTSMMSGSEREAATEEHARTSPSKEGGAQASQTNPFDQAKVSLNALSAAFDGLSGQTMQVDVHDEEKSHDNDLRDDVQTQQMRHESGIAEIQGMSLSLCSTAATFPLIIRSAAIIDELLGKQALGQVRDQVEKDITSQIDDIVKAQIAACLQDHIPQELQDEVENSKLELERARLSLHNMESRRLNGKLRSNKPDEILDTILMPDGAVSPHFPKDLRALFNLDAETCKAIASDYEFPQVSDSRDKNLNKIMQFVGVRYQLVRQGLGQKHEGQAPDSEEGKNNEAKEANTSATAKVSGVDD